jgi:hypothetical protein
VTAPPVQPATPPPSPAVLPSLTAALGLAAQRASRHNSAAAVIATSLPPATVPLASSPPPVRKRQPLRRGSHRHKLLRHQHALLAAAARATRLDRDKPLTAPESFVAAMASTACDLWRKAMDAELLKLGMHGTYSVEELPKGGKTVSSKWVYTVKHDSKGDIVELKARLVATCFSQKTGVPKLGRLC